MQEPSLNFDFAINTASRVIDNHSKLAISIDNSNVKARRFRNSITKSVEACIVLARYFNTSTQPDVKFLYGQVQNVITSLEDILYDTERCRKHIEVSSYNAFKNEITNTLNLYNSILNGLMLVAGQIAMTEQCDFSVANLIK